MAKLHHLKLRRHTGRGLSGYATKFWRAQRDRVILRDKMTCQICGQFILRKPQVDHIKPLDPGERSGRKFRERSQLDNLRLLCLPCHRKTHRPPRSRPEKRRANYGDPRNPWTLKPE